MHETGVIEKMLEVLRRVQEEHGGRRIEVITVEMSAFGGWNEEHFRQHFQEAVEGTPWQDARLDIKKVMIGPEAKLASVTFEEGALGVDPARR
jgi:Zn finger protein HypA/HybF involved in hydrogenase expression